MSSTIQNPVLGGFHPDPSVVRVGEWFYVATSTFIFVPGLPIYRSRDLVNWEFVSHALQDDQAFDVSEGAHLDGVWAPTLRHDVTTGRWYIVATISKDLPWPRRFRNLLIWADDPAGPWSAPLWIDDGGIDPDLFPLGDGTAYYARNGTDPSRAQGMRGYGIVLGRIELSTGAFLEPLRLVWQGHGDANLEAPHLYHIHDRWYLSCAAGGTAVGHCVTVARAPHPYGPWEGHPRNPVLSNRGSSSCLQSTGHMDVVQAADGSWWGLCLGVTQYQGTDGLSPLGRETCLFPISWAAGWPVCGVEGRVPETLTLPWPVQQPKSHTNFDDFQAKAWPWWWVFRNGYREECFRRNEQGLVLSANKQRLNGTGPMAFAGIRQSAQVASCSVDMSFLHGGKQGYGGLCVYASPDHHVDIGFVDEGRALELRLVLPGCSAVLARQECLTQRVQMRLRALGDRYVGECKRDGEAWQELGCVGALHFSSVIAQSYTGTLFALFAEGPGTSVRCHTFTCDQHR